MYLQLERLLQAGQPQNITDQQWADLVQLKDDMDKTADARERERIEQRLSWAMTRFLGEPNRLEALFVTGSTSATYTTDVYGSTNQNGNVNQQSGVETHGQ
jgi:hypothetical protein